MTDIVQAQKHPPPRTLVFGKLSRDYAMVRDRVPGAIRVDSDQADAQQPLYRLMDVPGGSALYASVGMLIWEPDQAPGLVARVGEDYHHQWLEEFSQRGINVSGVQILPQALDVRSFYVVTDQNSCREEDPVSYFARIGQPFPKPLFGYRPQDKQGNIAKSRTQMDDLSPRPSALSPELFHATAAHFCPLDYLSHTLLPGLLRQQGFTSLTIDPPEQVMDPIFWDDVPAMLAGLTACLPAEAKVRKLFHGRSTDLWEMAEGLARYGCEFVVIKRGPLGQVLYDRASKNRWEIPAYPARLVNTMGAGDAFCGGFLVGYRRSFDPVQAVLYGNIAASLVVEGSGAFYALEAMSGLAKARLEALAENVRKV
jgi:sugar/nucleoside kinase (ribokinase family)